MFQNELLLLDWKEACVDAAERYWPKIFFIVVINGNVILIVKSKPSIYIGSHELQLTLPLIFPPRFRRKFKNEINMRFTLNLFPLFCMAEQWMMAGYFRVAQWLRSESCISSAYISMSFTFVVATKCKFFFQRMEIHLLGEILSST